MASSSMASSVPESTSSSVGDDSEYDHDEWRMTDEQKEYYTNQFVNLQPNLEDVIKGLYVTYPTVSHSLYFYNHDKITARVIVQMPTPPFLHYQYAKLKFENYRLKFNID